MNLEIEQFNPTKAELTALVEKTKGITLTDFRDKAQFKVVKANQIMLRDARNSVLKMGKSLRENAVAFSKAVIEKEKEFVAIITPEEDRLKELLENAEKEQEIADRQALLPERKAKLEAVGDGVVVEDVELLNMDASAFMGYLNMRIAGKNQKDREALEARERLLKEAEDKVKRDKEIAEAQERARVEERERMEREQKAKDEQIARDTAAKIEADKKAEEDARKNAEAEEKARKGNERYQAFLAKNGWTEETKGDFHGFIEPKSGTYRLYKLVDTFKIKQDE